MKTRVALLSLFACLGFGCSVAGDCTDEACDDVGETFGPLENVAPLTGNPARYPIILVHGVNASSTKWGFYRVADALRKDGHVVYEAEVEPFNTPSIRARTLEKLVVRALERSPKVNLVAHSGGGIDARVLISELGYGDRVASLSTISSPHRGSFIGDVAGKLVPDGPISDAVDAIGRLWGRTFTSEELANNTDLREAFLATSESRAPKFNEEHPNDARVYYQSWAGVSSRVGIGNTADREQCEASYEGRAVDSKLTGRTDIMDASLRAASVVTGHGFGPFVDFRPNDGMVTVESAKWGHFRGCLRADHRDEIGQPNRDEPNQRTRFDHVYFYRGLAFELERLGF